jgi:hypothetical protein
MIRPYIYIITHTYTSEFYIGSRSANRTPASRDLWCNYFTSSKVIKERILLEGVDSFSAQVINEFNTPEEAFEAEQLLISKYISNPLCLNRTYQLIGKQAFLTTGTKRTVSEETRQKISKTLKSGAHKTYVRTEQHLEILSNNGKKTGGWNRGKSYNISKVSARKGCPSSRKGQHMPKHFCQHCGRIIGGISNFRKHLLNCS